MADNPGWTPRPRSSPEPLAVRRLVACVDRSDTFEPVLLIAAASSAALGKSMTIVTVADDGRHHPQRAPRASLRDAPHGETLGIHWLPVADRMDGRFDSTVHLAARFQVRGLACSSQAGSGVKPVDGGVGGFAQELDPGALDALIVRGRLDEVQELADGVVEPSA